MVSVSNRRTILADSSPAAATTDLRFWVLEAAEKLPIAAEGEFYASVDCAGLVVLACSEQQARSIAQDTTDGDWWLDPKLTRCSEVDVDGRPRVVLANWPSLD
jgi:hypothetical protein